MEQDYIPPYSPPCEGYWQTLLDEGPHSSGDVPGLWEWEEEPAIPAAVWEEARELFSNRVVQELPIDDYNRGGLIAHWKGIECFIPASHLISYPFPADPVAREQCFAEYLGKILRLCIIEVEPARNRILLSERQVAECEIDEPQWPDWLCIGGTCEGVVTSVRPFGAFVDIGPLEGMVHISEISWGRVRHPQDFLKPGQDVKVKIINLDLEHQRVGLSLKRLRNNPWDNVLDQLSPGECVEGAIASVERFGVFVELLEGIEGLLHISELPHISSCDALYQLYEAGEPITVRILEIIPNDHRIALGVTTAPDAA